MEGVIGSFMSVDQTYYTAVKEDSDANPLYTTSQSQTIVNITAIDNII